jgi:hypothetical protein
VDVEAAEIRLESTGTSSATWDKRLCLDDGSECWTAGVSLPTRVSLRGTTPSEDGGTRRASALDGGRIVLILAAASARGGRAGEARSLKFRPVIGEYLMSSSHETVGVETRRSSICWIKLCCGAKVVEWSLTALGALWRDCMGVPLYGRWSAVADVISLRVVGCFRHKIVAEGERAAL